MSAPSTDPTVSSTFTSTSTSNSSSSTSPSSDLIHIILYYKYVDLSSIPSFPLTALATEQQQLCTSLSLLGGIRIANEGINGSLAGSLTSINQYIDTMETLHNGIFTSIDWKRSTSPSSSLPPFTALHIRLTSEITASGSMFHCDPHTEGGLHLCPSDFHSAVLNMNREDTVLIDVRNIYETNIGKFENAIDPGLRAFHQFPAFCQQNLNVLKQKKVLMYCTGGIRCEKASAYMKSIGVKDVAQLKGGIHRYMEQFPDGGLFKGANFVFDKRFTMKNEKSSGSSSSSNNENGTTTEKEATATATTGGNNEVIGKCELCAVPYDIIEENVICTVCAVLLLMCTECQTKLTSLSEPLLCTEHILLTGSSLLRSLLFSRLSTSTLLIQLQQLYCCLLTSCETTNGKGRRHRHRRKQLKKQMKVIREEIEKRGEGEKMKKEWKEEKEEEEEEEEEGEEKEEEDKEGGKERQEEKRKAEKKGRKGKGERKKTKSSSESSGSSEEQNDVSAVDDLDSFLEVAALTPTQNDSVAPPTPSFATTPPTGRSKKKTGPILHPTMPSVLAAASIAASTLPNPIFSYSPTLNI